LRSKDPISCEKYRGDIEGERGKRVFDCLFKMLNKYFLSGRGGNCHVAAGRKKKLSHLHGASNKKMENAAGKSGKATETVQRQPVSPGGRFLFYLFMS